MKPFNLILLCAIIAAGCLSAATPVKDLVLQNDADAAGHAITNLATGSEADNAATKSYVDTGLDGKLTNDGGAVTVDSGTVLAFDFQDASGNTLNGIATGAIAVGHAGSADYDSGGSNLLSSLFDGTGGNVLLAVTATNADYAGQASNADTATNASNADTLGGYYWAGNSQDSVSLSGFYDDLGIASLFDGTGGSVAFANTAAVDPNGNPLSNLFDGTGGWVGLATYADNIDTGVSGYVSSSHLFDGSGGYVLQAEQSYSADHASVAQQALGDQYDNDLSSLFNGGGGWVIQASTLREGGGAEIAWNVNGYWLANIDVAFTPSDDIDPAQNGVLVIQKTSNTALTFKLKGSDGVVRSATITLAP